MRKPFIWLVLVTAAVACGPASGRSFHSGIVGRVLAGPTCPVERMPPDPQCRPRPLSARLRIRPAGTSGSGRVIHSGTDGRFRVGLDPGTYTITPLKRPGSAFPRPGPPQTVRVRSGRYTRVAITYDTGIR